MCHPFKQEGGYIKTAFILSIWSVADFLFKKNVIKCRKNCIFSLFFRSKPKTDKKLSKMMNIDTFTP